MTVIKANQKRLHASPQQVVVNTKLLSRDHKQALRIIHTLTQKAYQRYRQIFPQAEALFVVEKWLTGEENLVLDRMMVKMNANKKALAEYAELTFSKDNGSPDFSGIATTGRHVRTYK